MLLAACGGFAVAGSACPGATPRGGRGCSSACGRFRRGPQCFPGGRPRDSPGGSGAGAAGAAHRPAAGFAVARSAFPGGGPGLSLGAGVGDRGIHSHRTGAIRVFTRTEPVRSAYPPPIQGGGTVEPMASIRGSTTPEGPQSPDRHRPEGDIGGTPWTPVWAGVVGVARWPGAVSRWRAGAVAAGVGGWGTTRGKVPRGVRATAFRSAEHWELPRDEARVRVLFTRTSVL